MDSLGSFDCVQLPEQSDYDNISAVDSITTEYDLDYDYRLCGQEPTNPLYLMLAPGVIAGGTLGNVCILAVVQYQVFKREPIGFLLGLLAVCDTAVLYTELLHNWLRILTRQVVNIPIINSLACQCVTFLGEFCPQLALWVLMLVNIDRLILVTDSARYRGFTSKSQGSLAAVILTFLLAGFNAHTFLLFSVKTLSVHVNNHTIVEHKACQISHNYDLPSDYIQIYTLASFIVQNLLPLGFLLISTLITICKMVLMKRKMEDEDILCSFQHSMTRMITVVNIITIISVLPTVILFAVKRMAPDIGLDWHSLYVASHLVYYVCFAVKCVAYGINSNVFKRKLYRAFCCGL